MKFQGAVSLPGQQAGQGLGIAVGHIVKGVATLAAEEGAGVDAEFRVEGADAAITRGVEPGELDAFLHEPAQGGGVLADHPVVHGLHQHQHHVFPRQGPGHGIVRRGGLLGEVGIHLLHASFPNLGVAGGVGVDFVDADVFPRQGPGHGIVRRGGLLGEVGIHLLHASFPNLGVAGGVGVDFVDADVLDQGLAQAAHLVEPVGVEHVLVGSFRRLRAAIVRAGIADAAVAEKHRLGQKPSPHTGGCRQTQGADLAPPETKPPHRRLPPDTGR